MGWMKRAREAEERKEQHTWRVRRWTSFAEAVSDEARKHREDRLTAIGAMIERKLRQVTDERAAIKVVRVSGQPQLMFELTVVAPNPEAARAKARYYIDKALSVKIPTPIGVVPKRVGRDVKHVTDTTTLRPPWGKWSMDEVKPTRTLRVGRTGETEDTGAATAGV